FIESYLKLTLLDQAIATHKAMAGFYRRYLREGSAETQLLHEAMAFAEQRLTQRWKDYVSKVQALEQYFTDNYESRYLNEPNSEVGRRVLKVRTLFEQFNPTIKLLVTYPNMIMLGYYAAKVRLDAKIQTGFG